MFFQAVRLTSSAVMQVLILAGVGFFLKKRKILSEAGLDAISRLVMDVTLPLLIFCQLVRDFNFKLYPNWWVFPLVSIAVTITGLLSGLIFIRFIPGLQRRLQFLNLVTFQNSGYLPLAMVAGMLPGYKVGSMFIYLFLFLIGFNLIIWPLAGYIFSFSRRTKFEFINLLNPPVIAAILGVFFVFFRLHYLLPGVFIKPLRLIGDCTLPLAMFVVGADLAQVKVEQFDLRSLGLLILAKLVILPALGLWFVSSLRLPELVGLLIVLELAVPPATSLVVIMRHYKKEDFLISQGIFLGHIVSLVTLPLFLSLYFSRIVIK